MALAFATLHDAGTPLEGDLVLLATVDEETGGLGARAFVESGGMQGIGAVVIGEPTSLDLVIAHRGALWVEIEASGRAAHGAMPQEGANAILPVAALLTRLAAHRFDAQPHPLLAPPTLNVGTIQGGAKTNMVPDRCRASVDMRTLPGQSHAAMVATIQSMAAEEAARVPGVAVEVVVTNDKPPLVTPRTAPLVRQARTVLRRLRGVEPAVRGAAYLTDGALLASESGTPAIVCGPGPETMAHQVDESLEVSQLLLARRFYTALARAWLQPDLPPLESA
jgi:succinyl-diaminopimelate desuccinylase